MHVRNVVHDENSVGLYTESNMLASQIFEESERMHAH